MTAGAELFAEELADMDALQSVCDELRVALEDWTSSVTNLCRACSEGRPHDHHHHEAGEGWKTNRHVGLAAATGALLREALARWQGSARKVLDLVHLPTV